MVVLLTVTGMLALGTTAATANPVSVAEAAVIQTLKANPGSVRTGENTVLLKTGLMVTVPNGKVGINAASQCRRGWACFWLHANFEGPIGQIREGDHVWFRDYWYSPAGVVVFSPGVRPGPEWQNFYRKVSSVYNNTNGTTARFHPVLGDGRGDYLVEVGGQRPYLGALFNDDFDKACICG
jgi:hypothetical protein